MELGVDGRVAFCTGGSKGMGREVARMLAAEGCRVAIVARTKEDVDATVKEIESEGGTAVGIYADVSVRGDVDRAVAECTEAFGAPLIVIGQAQHIVPGDFPDITDLQHYVSSFHAYTMSTLYLLHAVLPAMKDAGWGRFVHIGSATAKEPTGAIHHVIANTTRPSTVGLLKTVADEYAQFGITVNTIAPGWIATQTAYEYVNKNLGFPNEADLAEWMRTVGRVPAGRMGKPEEIASAIVYLCSVGAGYITGKYIEVDGGVHSSAF